MKIISYEYSKVKSVCDIGKCHRAAHHRIILLGEELVLCKVHLEQLYAEALELCDQYQEKREGKPDDR